MTSPFYILYFIYISATNLQVTTHNDQPVEDFLANLKHLEPVGVIKNLVLHGNLTVNSTNNVETVNEILFENIIDKVIKRTDIKRKNNNSYFQAKQNIGLSGGLPLDFRFTGRIELDNLATFVINDINLFNLTPRFLFRELNQTIAAPFRSRRIKVGKNIGRNSCVNSDLCYP